MTTHDLRGPVLALLSLCLACAAPSGDAGTDGTDAGTDGTDAGETTTGSGSGDTIDDTTDGHTGNLTRGSDESGGSSSTSSSSGDTGAGAPAFGDFALSRGDATITPPGCAVDRGGASPWSITLDAPTGDDGSFVLHESYGPYTGVFDCAATDEPGFSCTRSLVVDYAAMGGPDARVQLDSSYLGTWRTDGTIAGSYDAAFTCTGTACDDATADWNLTAFPCDVAVEFTGAAIDPGGA